MLFIKRESTAWAKLILPTISLLSIFVLSTAFAPGQVDTALEGLLEDIKSEKIMSWELAGGDSGFGEENIYQLRMWADGSYEEVEDGQQMGGLWTIDKREDKIVFLCKSANGYDLNGVNPPIPYEVESYSADELVLVWQANGAKIRKIYKRIPTPYRG